MQENCTFGSVRGAACKGRPYRDRQGKTLTRKVYFMEGENSQNAPRDWLLETLVNLANQFELGIPITLIVQGAVITGQLIGVKQYFTEYGSVLGQGFRGLSEEIAASVQRIFTDTGDQSLVSLRDRNQQDTEESEPESPTYIHLKDTKFVFGSSLTPEGNGVLWRGRISEVVGFSLGTLERSV